MFRSNGQPNGVWLDALVCQFRFGELAVCRGSWMDHQALYIGYIGKQREYFQAVNK